MSNKLRLTFGYAGTDFTRNYTVANVADSLKSGIKDKILALNSSLAGGNSGGLNTFFRSDDFDSDNNVGNFNKITAAQLESTQITVIPLVEEEDENNG